MDLEQNFVLNFTSVAVAFVTTIITFVTVAQKLKNRWPVKVNCWFCNNDSKIYRQQRDWWLCSFCEQHNGFTKNGDYNFEIPEQYKSPAKNFVRYSKLSSAERLDGNNGLCVKCNKNEEKKMLELANFEPSNHNEYNLELDVFKQHLEEKYSLCPKCSKFVEAVLSKQASWLLQYKMAFFKNKPIQNIINNGEKWERIFRISLILLNSILLYDFAFWPLPIVGMLLQLGACLASPPNKQGLDMVAAFFWVFIILLLPFKELKLLKIHLQNAWFAIEFVTQHHVMVGLTVIIGLMNVRLSSFTVGMKPIVSLKKLESPKNKKLQAIPPIPRAATMASCMAEKAIENDNPNIKHCRSPVNITNLLMTPVSVETPMPIKPTLFMQNSGMFDKDPMGTRLPLPNYCMKQNQNPYSSNSLSYRSFDDKTSLNESLSTLSTLSLSNSNRKQISKIPEIFQTKVYDSASPDLFTKLNKSPNRKFVLSPPKLKSVTQSSWVAGGYWQAGMDVPTLSRSSSQSSGFGSIGSNFVHSREPSVYNDYDRYSVVSDMTQCCHMSRHLSANSLNSCCRQGSAFSFQRPDSPVNRQFSKVPTKTTVNHQSMPLLQNLHQTDQHSRSQVTQVTSNNSDSRDVQEIPRQTIHTTVLTSPIWLPVLLCGSLVFNMIVLCTTLLR
ncbi:uncharacterized protein LOC105687667 [Athalia rosae]|uniref:uncharacterized protein LOC105687667 n=1 Tax=Athalia rosae TaxID=37344 RepID=UPI002033A88A|nr:uncharacterized protein LOC105687667 [Athalia rosae]